MAEVEISGQNLTNLQKEREHCALSTPVYRAGTNRAWTGMPVRRMVHEPKRGCLMIQEEEEEGKEEEQRGEGEGDKENLEEEELVQGKTA